MTTFKALAPFRYIYSGLILFVAVDCAQAAIDERQFTYAAAHFRAACSSELSETAFRKYFESVDAKKANAAGMSFSVAYGLPGFIGATYFRQPAKCCVSIRDAPLDLATDRMSRNLGLLNPRRLTLSNRMLIIFQPSHSNRVVSMDWSSSATESHSMTSICHSVYPNAEEFYQSLRK